MRPQVAESSDGNSDGNSNSHGNGNSNGDRVRRDEKASARSHDSLTQGWGDSWNGTRIGTTLIDQIHASTSEVGAFVLKRGLVGCASTAPACRLLPAAAAAVSNARPSLQGGSACVEATAVPPCCCFRCCSLAWPLWTRYRSLRCTGSGHPSIFSARSRSCSATPKVRLES